MRSVPSSLAVLVAACSMLLALPPEPARAGAASQQAPATVSDDVDTTTVEEDDSAGAGLAPASWVPGLVLAAGWVLLLVLQLRRGRHLRRVTSRCDAPGAG